MENLRTLISGFLGLVILVRWALVTMFLELLRQAAASIGLMSAWSGQVRVDIQLISWNVFCYSQLRRLTGSNLLTFFLTYLLTYLLTFFLTYQNQNLTSTASQKKPLCKLYIYLAPRSKSNIHDNFVPVNVIALSASDRPAKRQLSPKMQNACSSTHTHTRHMHQTAPPKGSWVQKCKRVWSATTTSHGVCKPWSQMLATAVLAPVLHRWPCSARCLSPIHALHPPKTRPKYERLQRASPALARPPHLEQASLHMPHTTCFPPRLLPW